MPSKKNKTRVTRKKAVKTTARKPVKKATVSKVKKAKSKSSLVAVSAPASTPTSPRPPRPRLSVKKPEQTKVMPARKVGRAYTTKAVDESSPQTGTEVVEHLKKNQRASSPGVPALGSSVSVAAKGPRPGHAAGPQNKSIPKVSRNTIHNTSGDIVEPQTSETTTSLHKGSGDNTVGHAKKPFKERRRLENDKKEYQQGALFMDEFETYQESDLEETAKNTGRRYTQRKADKHTMEASAKAQGSGQSSRRKNGEWRDEERSENQQPQFKQPPSQHSPQQQQHQVHAQATAGEREAAENMPVKAGQHGQASGDVGQLQIKLSNSLYRKLIAKAEMEGVTVDEFAGELLAEGLVLRAWEIMERKSAMRTGHTGNSGNYGGQQNRQQNRYGFRNNNAGGHNSNNSSNNSNSNYNRGRPQHGGNNSNHGNMSSGGGSNRGRMSYSNIMEDSANFLEYVRSQEKKQK